MSWSKSHSPPSERVRHTTLVDTIPAPQLYAICCDVSHRGLGNKLLIETVDMVIVQHLSSRHDINTISFHYVMRVMRVMRVMCVTHACV
jgi:hypothetical protein